MRIIIFLFFISAIACENSQLPPMGTCTKYFPSEVYSNDYGAVWKYYMHITPDSGQRKTNIKYRKIKLENSKLYLTDYASDFLETYCEVISIEDDKWLMDSSYKYNYRGVLDSLRTTKMYNIGDENILLDWHGGNHTLQRSIEGDSWSNRLIEKQLGVRDTVVNTSKRKVFYGEVESEYYSGSDTVLTIYQWQREYTVGRGMTSQNVQTDQVSYQWELDEIISLREFEERSNHGMHRVGYIDPEESLDSQKDFKTCYNISKINDYYNDDRAQISGGKGRLWRLVNTEIDPILLKDQNGYFTFRFVVNCKGEAGRFTTEESDLNYNRIEFSSALREHILSLLLAVPKWKNLTIRGEPRDAYVYITFKIENDVIVEILP